jgi:hypothetical protein
MVFTVKKSNKNKTNKLRIKLIALIDKNSIVIAIIAFKTGYKAPGNIFPFILEGKNIPIMRRVCTI